jgi:hypothetical protein
VFEVRGFNEKWRLGKSTREIPVKLEWRDGREVVEGRTWSKITVPMERRYDQQATDNRYVARSVSIS